MRSRRDHAGISDQRRASLRRRLDARRLGEGGINYSRGAVYLAGYGVECKLKVILMERHNCLNLNDLIRRLGVNDTEIYQHGLESLLAKMPSVLMRLKADTQRWREFVTILNRWRPAWRYNPEPYAEPDVFLVAADNLCAWLENNYG